MTRREKGKQGLLVDGAGTPLILGRRVGGGVEEQSREEGV